MSSEIAVPMSLSENLAKVKDQIFTSAKKANRNSSSITLVGVTKTAGREAIAEAFSLGLTNFGENRIPDAEEKFSPPPFPLQGATLHLIGHLQTNKARRAVNLFDLVHSVDSLKLAQSLNRFSTEKGKKLPVLLQVNVAGEESKEGLEPSQLGRMMEEIMTLSHLEPQGLMTIAPFFQNSEAARPVFSELRELFEKYHPGTPSWRHLSMGMTNDFMVAIEEGATMVRIGRAIF